MFWRKCGFVMKTAFENCFHKKNQFSVDAGKETGEITQTRPPSRAWSGMSVRLGDGEWADIFLLQKLCEVCLSRSSV